MRATAVLSLFLLASSAAAAIRGTIVGAGQPVANVKIAVHPVQTLPELLADALANRARPVMATATSAADGTFALPVDGAGSVVVHVEAANFAASFSEETIGDTEALISLSPARRREFTVRSAAGPLASARVLQIIAGGAIVEAVTNDRGRVTLFDLDPMPVVVVHPRAALQMTLVEPRRDSIDVEAAVALKGKVVDGAGRGVKGARIAIDAIPAAVSADDGAFVVERAPRKYSALAADAGELGGSVAGGGTTIRVVPRHLVSGIVRDAERRPLRGVAVMFVGGASAETAVSDEKGAYAVHVAAGTAAVISGSAAYRFDQEQIDVRKTVVKDLVAKRVPMLSGVVRNARDGSTVAGAQIVLAMHSEMSDALAALEPMSNVAVATTWSGPDGRFRVAPLPEIETTMKLVAYKRGLPPGDSVDFQRGKPMAGRPPDVTIGKALDVSGVVRDTAGRPVAGVAITAVREGLLLIGSLADPPRTDGDGRFSVPLADGTWRLAFSKERYLPNALPGLKVFGAVKGLEIALESAAEIRGRVVRKNGSGVAHVIIMEEGTTVETAADGTFVLPPTSKGAHDLRYFFAGGSHGELQVTAPAADVRIMLKDTGTLRGRIVDDAGKPVSSFEISVTLAPDGFRIPKQFSDAEGRFVWENAPAGKATVSAASNGYIAATRTVVVEAGKTTEIKLTLRR